MTIAVGPLCDWKESLLQQDSALTTSLAGHLSSQDSRYSYFQSNSTIYPQIAVEQMEHTWSFNPIALRKAKTP